MRLPPKSPGFPHSAILHAIVRLLLSDFAVENSLTIYGSVPQRLAGCQKTF